MSMDNLSKFMESLSASRLGPASDIWKYADTFTVRQVAFLWGGHEPLDGYLEGRDRPPQFGAVTQLLIGEIENGTLPAKKLYAALRADENALVKRNDLKVLCEGKQEYPEFLFDTRPDSAGAPELNLEIGEQFAEEPSFAEKQGGRRSVYNWNKIFAAVILIEGQNGLPSGLIEKCRVVREFIENGYSFEKGAKPRNVPDISTIQRKMSDVFADFDMLRKKHNEEKRK